MKIRRFKPLALAMAAAWTLGATGWAHAQASTDVGNEVQNLKTQVQQLQLQLRQQQNSAVDADEFNRIRLKVEAAEDNQDMLGFKGLKISGMMDPTFVYNRGRDTSGFQFLNNFDGSERSGTGDGYAYDNSYFGQAMLDIQKETENGTKWRLTLAPHKSASSGYNVGSIVHEATISMPIDGPSKRLIAGQMPDWSGYEYIWSNMQPLISHNLLFDFTIPSYYSGAGMEMSEGKWITKFMLANINKSYRSQGDKDPGLVYRADYAKGEFSGFGVSGAHGFNNNSGDHGRFDMIEVDGYYVRGDITLQGQLGLGSMAGAASNGGMAKWTGMSGLIAYKANPRTQLIARVDVINNSKNGGGVYGNGFDASAVTPGDPPPFDDRNGFGPGRDASGAIIDPNQGANRQALTLGVNHQLAGPHTANSWLWPTGTWLKAEIRRDMSSAYSFLDAKTGNYSKSNTTIMTSLVFAF